jgi:K+-sensing histidine kinase KdpD
MLVAGAADERHLKLMRQLNIKSVMLVPLRARNQTIGLLVLAHSKATRTYQTSDLILAEELARRAAIAIDNARLYAEAQDAIRGRDEFLSVAAHELKTPVTSIQGFAQLTLRQLDKTETLDKDRVIYSFRRITDQTQRLSVFVSQLLDISRIQAGRLLLNKQLVDIGEIVNAAVVNPARYNRSPHHHG